MDEPETNTTDILKEKKTKKDLARCKILHTWLLNPKRNKTSQLPANNNEN